MGIIADRSTDNATTVFFFLTTISTSKKTVFFSERELKRNIEKNIV